MTTRESKACVICMNDFDTTSRQTVALPCGHNFCLTCLVCLKASESPVCPQCRQSFAEIELPGLSRMAKVSGKSNFMTKGELAGCKVHREPFVYWSTRSNELYCTTCILSADINTSCLKRISDAIPLIQDNLECKARSIKKGITSDLANHKEEHRKAVEELAKLNNFEKSIRELKADYQQFIKKVDSHNSKLREQSNSVHKIEEEISETLSKEDIEIALSYMETLNELHKTFGCQKQGKNFEGCCAGGRSRSPETSYPNCHLAIGYGYSRGSEVYDKPKQKEERRYNPKERYSDNESYYVTRGYNNFTKTYEPPVSNNQVQHMMRPAKLLSDIACAFEEGEMQEAAFIQNLQQEMQRRMNRSGSATPASLGGGFASRRRHRSDERDSDSDVDVDCVD